MKRSDIQPGVVYGLAAVPEWDRPRPVVFIDAAKTLWQHDRQRGRYHQVEQDKRIKPRRGDMWSSARGYAVVTSDYSYRRRAGAAAQELEEYIRSAGLETLWLSWTQYTEALNPPLPDHLRFDLVYSIRQVRGTFAEASGVYDAHVQAREEERDRQLRGRTKAAKAQHEFYARVAALREGLGGFGVVIRGHIETGSFSWSLDSEDAEYVLSALEAAEQSGFCLECHCSSGSHNFECTRKRS